MTTFAQLAAEKIQQQCPDFKPHTAFILGSGLGAFAEHLQDKMVFDYSDLPGFPVTTVAGHAGRLHIGYLNKVPVLCLQGRAHYYEGYGHEIMCTLIRTLKLLGCEALITTNAVGSLHAHIGPGELALIEDHINFQGTNPLVGANAEQFGNRFVSMDEAYNLKLRERLSKAAQQLDINLHKGVYGATLGPVFETPAEIRAYARLGVDFVGMSTVAEVIVANHCELPVAAVSCVTNLAAGMSQEKLSHAGTLEAAQLAVNKLTSLLAQVLIIT